MTACIFLIKISRVFMLMYFMRPSFPLFNLQPPTTTHPAHSGTACGRRAFARDLLDSDVARTAAVRSKCGRLVCALAAAIRCVFVGCCVVASGLAVCTGEIVLVRRVLIVAVAVRAAREFVLRARCRAGIAAPCVSPTGRGQ